MGPGDALAIQVGKIEMVGADGSGADKPDPASFKQ
jgi:hypothetical protein